MAKDNGNGTVTVVSGDTLSAIARKYNTTVKALQDLNKAAYPSLANNPNLIRVGWVLRVTSSSPSKSAPTNPVNNQPTNVELGLVSSSGTGYELMVTWAWDKAHTKEYKVRWYYSWGDGKAPYEDHTVSPADHKWDTFTPPDYVYNDPEGQGHVTVIITPISDTKNDQNQTKYWTASSSTKVTYHYTSVALTDTPSAPSVKIEDLKLTAEVDNIPDDVTQVRFQVVKDNSSNTYKEATVNVTSNHASYSCDIESGGNYKVRCKYITKYKESEWSQWSGGDGTKPNAPSGFTVCRARDETSVYLEWGAVPNTDSYEIGYATEREYFNGSSEVTTVRTTTTNYILTNLSSGDEYFFALKAVNSVGESGWSEISSVIVGTEPAAPTTWSSISKVVVGETFTLYWTHNSEDSSTQNKATIELIINDVTETIEIFTAEQEDDKKTTWYPITTTHDGVTNIEPIGGTIKVVEGATILWRVRTAGATGVYGDWSIQRTIDIYAKPTMSINILDYTGAEVSTVTQFPIHIQGSSGPKAQMPVGYHLSVVSNDYYETVDEIGMRKVVNEGQEIYSKYLDSSSYTPTFELSAGNIDLENNVSYTVKCVVSMDSSLTGEDKRDFTVAWTDERYDPNAEIGLDKEGVTTVIRPYCKDENGELVEDVSLSVYRREFDGGFTELMTGIDNMKNTHIVDPHPALDYARYRIVAISNSTGAVSYYDMPGYEVGEKAIIIQWNEYWSDFDITSDYIQADSTWTGSMLKLPYNIDISDDHTPDVSLINYIGRKHPVGYYGTQVGHTASWNVEIPKNDKETLYAIRRLANWMGDVYVREPSGSGYWANITISYSQTHLKTVIPVKLSVKRVSGGA